MRADADGRSARASACFRVCDVAVWPTQVRADRRARQPHAGLHSHAVCHFHPRLCIPSLPFSLRLPLSLIFPRQREQKPPPSPSPSPFPLLAANQHVLRHSNTAPRPSSVLSLSFCPISHPFADALRIIEYESPCMSASVTTLLFLGCFFVCRALVRRGMSCGHLARAPSNKTQSTEEKINDHSQRESNNGCPLPPVNTPIIISLPPQRAVSHCPPPALLTALHLFPPQLSPPFFGLKGGDFLIVRFCSDSSPLSDPDVPTAAYANGAPFSTTRVPIKACKPACIYISKLFVCNV